MGIIIRKVLVEEAYDYAVNHIACLQDAYKGIIPDDYLANMAAQKSKLERDYVKLSVRTRELISDKYKIVMSILFSDRELIS